MPEPTLSPRPRWRLLLVAWSLLVLSGCASVYVVDSQVQGFARWDAASAPQPPQAYRFERLPSQSVDGQARTQDALEALTRTALARAGWSLAEAPASAAWTVQVVASSVRLPRSPWADPWPHPWGSDRFWGGGQLFIGGGAAFGGVGFMRLDLPYHQRQVALLIRRASDGQVAFETRAAHDGVWNDTPELWGAMLDAALRDFPTPPVGMRPVRIEVPR